MAKRQWEYWLELLSPNPAEAHGALNRLGKDAWELVTVLHGSGERDPDSRVAIFKREVASTH